MVGAHDRHLGDRADVEPGAVRRRLTHVRDVVVAVPRRAVRPRLPRGDPRSRREQHHERRERRPRHLRPASERRCGDPDRRRSTLRRRRDRPAVGRRRSVGRPPTTRASRPSRPRCSTPPPATGGRAAPGPRRRVVHRDTASVGATSTHGRGRGARRPPVGTRSARARWIWSGTVATCRPPGITVDIGGPDTVAPNGLVSGLANNQTLPLGPITFGGRRPTTSVSPTCRWASRTAPRCVGGRRSTGHLGHHVHLEQRQPLSMPGAARRHGRIRGPHRPPGTTR